MIMMVVTHFGEKWD